MRFLLFAPLTAAIPATALVQSTTFEDAILAAVANAPQLQAGALVADARQSASSHC